LILSPDKSGRRAFYYEKSRILHERGFERSSEGV